MKKIIDNLDNTSGWTGHNGASIHGLNDHIEYIAGNNSKSLVFKFESVDSYVEKTFNEDLTDYKELIFWVYSAKKRGDFFRKTSDYFYKINLGVSKEYYLPTRNYFYWVRINISDLDTLDSIRLTSLHSDTDYIVVSYLLVNKDIFPLDIFQGLKEQLELEIQFTSLNSVGLVSCLTGDETIDFSSPVNFLDKYSVIKIDDGVNSERHHIQNRVTSTKFSFSNLYDGRVLLNDYTNANVYLEYPVEFGTSQKEIVLPSITIWGFAPEKIFLTNELDKFVDTVETTGTFQETQVGNYFNWDILIDCEVKEEFEILSILSEIVRKVISKKIVWINGRKGYVEFSAKVNEIYPNEFFDIVPKVQFPVNITIREDSYEPSTLVRTSLVDFGVNIVEQGEL